MGGEEEHARKEAAGIREEDGDDRHVDNGICDVVEAPTERPSVSEDFLRDTSGRIP